MANALLESGSEGWHGKHAYTMAVVYLLAGLAIGYLFRGSEPSSPRRLTEATRAATAGSGIDEQTPSLAQMKHMAEKKAEPLLKRLKEDPKNADLLVQVGDVYKQTHQFKDAANFYERSLKIDPKNAGVRSDLASVLYYTGDVDGALAQLQEALKYDAKNGAALFNLGMIQWQGKKDRNGAVAAWEELLKTNPRLTADRKATVEKLIAQAKQGSKN
jgi:cytochrome c-type biogenesis protein CcmH/NrfG